MRELEAPPNVPVGEATVQFDDRDTDPTEMKISRLQEALDLIDALSDSETVHVRQIVDEFEESGEEARLLFFSEDESNEGVAVTPIPPDT